MNVSITLNEMTVEHANAVLALLAELNGVKPQNEEPAQPQEGVPLFEAPVTVPAAAPIPPTPAAAIPAVAQTTAIPAQTAAPVYTVQQLGQAARPLMEQGRQPELINLLAEFGVRSVAELPENRRADFAARLRALGGAI